MAASRIAVMPFLEAARPGVILDVRSPGEYAHAHIPGAYSLPLFTDEERSIIGTAYKKESREAAIKIGLDAFGPKMRSMVEAAASICKKNAAQSVYVHCWRGGMRSEAVAWLLDLYGFEVYLLEGGYKAYRQWAISHWDTALRFRILAGNTGSGKTKVLHRLQQAGQAVLDLEDLAKHRGSAFGSHPDIPQPTQEMFENLLAGKIEALNIAHPNQMIWVEDESQRIGDLNIPHAFFRRHSSVQKIFMEVPFEERLDKVVAEYSLLLVDKLVNSILRIKKRLGPVETKTALGFLVEGDTKECFRILLKYYDKHYYPAGSAGLTSIDCSGKSEHQISATLLELYP